MPSYKDLDIYKLSYDLALKTHNATLQLPRWELFEEGSQVRRSSKGVTSCIVEGYGRRRYKAEFVKFLVYAQASCDETVVHLKFIAETQNSHKEKFEKLIECYEELGRRINRFISYVESKWNIFPPK